MENATNDSLTSVVLNWYTSRLRLQYTFMLVATGAVASNIWICLVFYQNRKLFSRSRLLIALASGHILRGTWSFYLGLWRLILLVSGEIDQSVTPWYCLLTFLPTLILASLALTSLVHLAIGVERILAMAAPNWYRIHWKPRLASKIICSIGLLIIIWLIPSWSIAVKEDFVTKECVITKILCQSYQSATTFGSTLIITVAVFLTLVALRIGRRRLGKLALNNERNKKDIKRLKRQLKYTKMMLSLSSCDILLTLLPYFMLILYVYNLIELASPLGYFSTIGYFINSLVSIFTYTAYNRQFRIESLKLCCMLKKGACVNNIKCSASSRDSSTCENAS